MSGEAEAHTENAVKRSGEWMKKRPSCPTGTVVFQKTKSWGRSQDKMAPRPVCFMWDGRHSSATLAPVASYGQVCCRLAGLQVAACSSNSCRPRPWSTGKRHGGDLCHPWTRA